MKPSVITQIHNWVGYSGRMTLPYSPEQAERVALKLIKLEDLHRELASYYRTKSRDRRTIANLWYHIDGLELDLRVNEGYEL